MKKRKPIFLLAFLLFGSSLWAIPMEFSKAESDKLPLRRPIDRGRQDEGSVSENDDGGGDSARSFFHEVSENNIEEEEVNNNQAMLAPADTKKVFFDSTLSEVDTSFQRPAVDARDNINFNGSNHGQQFGSVYGSTFNFHFGVTGSASSAAQEVVLSLEQFRAALENNPQAARFIIQQDDAGNSLIKALQEETPNSPIIRAENMAITKALKAALDSEAPGTNVKDLFAINPMSTLTSYPSLSHAKLRNVFEKIDGKLSNNSTSSWKIPQLVITGNERERLRENTVPDFNNIARNNIKRKLTAEVVMESYNECEEAEAKAARFLETQNGQNQSKFIMGALSSFESAIAQAKKFKETAEAAEIKAVSAKLNNQTYPFDEQTQIYSNAEKSWIEVATAYQKVLENIWKNKFEDQDLNDSFDKAVRAAQTEAEIWRAHLLLRRVKQDEQSMSDSITLEQADNMESAWQEVMSLYDDLLTKATTLNEARRTSLVADYNDTNKRREIWKTKVKELESLSTSNDPAAAEQRRLRKLAREKEHLKKTLQAIKSGTKLLAYERWSLPGEEEKIKPIFDESAKRKFEEIPPPKISEKKLEELGKEFFEKARQKRLLQEAQNSGINFNEISSISIAQRKERIETEILNIARRESGESKKRWEVRQKVNKLMSQAASAVRKTDSEAPHLLEVKEIREEQEAIIYQIEHLPKNLSVIGTTAIGTTTICSNNSKSSLYNVDDAKSFDQIMKSANEADKIWENLVKMADQKRLAAGGIPLDPDELMQIWEEVDQQAAQEREKKEKQQRQEKIAVEYREDWEENMSRWNTRMDADCASQKTKEPQQKVEQLKKEYVIIQQKARWSQDAKKIKKELAQAQEQVESINKQAIQSEEKWQILALQHHSILKVEEENKKEMALEKLKKSDQAVLNLWYDLAQQYDDERRPEEIVMREEIPLKTNKPSQVKILREWFFKELVKIEQKFIEAQKDYARAKISQTKTAAKELYEKADQLEKALQNNYQKKIQEAAVEDAQNGIFAIELENYVNESKKKREEIVQENAKVPPNLPSEEISINPWPRLLKQMECIEQADYNALRYLKKEQERLNNIREFFKIIIEAKKEEERINREKAAASPDHWSTLHDEERYLHDEGIRLEDENMNKAIQDKIEVAKEAAKVERTNVRKNPSSLFIKAAQKAQANFKRFQYEKIERQRAIEAGKWGSQSFEEREKELAGRIQVVKQQQEESGTREMIPLVDAETYWIRALEADRQGEYEHFLFWRNAAEMMEIGATYHREAANLINNQESKKLWEYQEVWKQFGREAEKIAKQYVGAITLLNSKKEKIQKELNEIDENNCHRIDCLEESVCYLKKAVAAWQEGNSNQAIFYKKVAEQNQKLPQYQQSVEGWVNHLIHTGADSFLFFPDSLNDAFSLLESVEVLKISIGYFKSAAEQGRSEEKISPWEEASQSASLLAEKCHQLEKKTFQHLKGYETQITTLFLSLIQVDSLASKAKFTEKKQEAEKKGNLIQSEKWNQAIESVEEVLGLFKEEKSIVEKIEEDFIRMGNAINKKLVEWYDANNAQKKLGVLIEKIIRPATNKELEKTMRWEKACSLYQQTIRSCTQSTTSYVQGQKEIYESWRKCGENSYQAAERLVDMEIEEKVGELFQEIARRYEKQAQAYQQRIDALAQGNKAQADLFEHAAKVQEKVAETYKKVFAEKHRHVAEAYFQQAQAYQQQASALVQGNKAQADLFEYAARVQEKVAETYKKVFEEKQPHVAEAYFQQVTAYQQQAGALVQGNKAQADLFESIAMVQANVVVAQANIVRVGKLISTTKEAAQDIIIPEIESPLFEQCLADNKNPYYYLSQRPFFPYGHSFVIREDDIGYIDDRYMKFYMPRWMDISHYAEVFYNSLFYFGRHGSRRLPDDLFFSKYSKQVKETYLQQAAEVYSQQVQAHEQQIEALKQGHKEQAEIFEKKAILQQTIANWYEYECDSSIIPFSLSSEGSILRQQAQQHEQQIKSQQQQADELAKRNQGKDYLFKQSRHNGSQAIRKKQKIKSNNK